MEESEAKPRQAAVIPVRSVGAGLQVCLIRRRTGSKWSIPKGYIERGDWRRSALDEAHEEAGLRGRLLTDVIGTYDYEKGPVTLTVVVGVMEVVEELATWQEQGWRERRWCSVEDAAALLSGHPVGPLYDRLRPTLAAMARAPQRRTKGGPAG